MRFESERCSCSFEFDYKDCAHCFEKNGLSLTAMSGIESYWSLPQALGKGGFRKIVIRKGFEIWITDCELFQDICCNEKSYPSAVSFGFCLAGNYRGILDRPHMSFEIGSGEHYLFFAGELQGSGQLFEGVKQFYVSVMIDLDLLFSYFEENGSFLPEVLRDVLSEKGDACILRVERMTPVMHKALRQILYCPYRDVSRKLFLESRCLELIACQLQQFSVLKNALSGDRQGSALHPSEKSAIERVSRMLLDNLDAALHLNDLAAVAGMSHPKLNRCFRQLYGKTVFEFIRHERLNKARELIESHGRTVTETAYMVGYSSISHFSKLYKHHFGISPGAGIQSSRIA